MTLHPVIRIISLLILAGFVVAGGWLDLLMALTLLVILQCTLDLAALNKAWRMLKRLRWLFRSILVVYFWFTPGEPVIMGYPQWSPTIQGMLQGGFRVLCLVIIVLAVNMLLVTTALEKLTAGLLWICYPLSLLGIKHERLAVRLALTFEAVKEIQGMYDRHFEGANTLREKVAQSGAVMIELFQQVTITAQNMNEKIICVTEVRAPGLFQWLVPVVLGGVFWVL